MALSRREREVLRLMAAGYGTKAIAGQLWISAKTVEGHMRGIFNKLDLPGDQGMIRRVQAARWWWEHEPREENRNT